MKYKSVDQYTFTIKMDMKKQREPEEEDNPLTRILKPLILPQGAAN